MLDHDGVLQTDAGTDALALNVVLVLQRLVMKTMTAREANHGFSDLLARVERGEEVLITKHGTPVAVVSPYRPPAMTPERKAAIDHALKLMAKGLPWGDKFRRFTRDEMHER
ncbi:MAG TPA: type II toxin-antitoxin system prevent-host-death family antitoxin [Xanthobacteraceae bacterium]|nr:type II toxin-antitoxin system prevent-host-death family antitoxin [Xanthobacteraceae bacterium]